MATSFIPYGHGVSTMSTPAPFTTITGCSIPHSFYLSTIVRVKLTGTVKRFVLSIEDTTGTMRSLPSHRVSLVMGLFNKIMLLSRHFLTLPWFWPSHRTQFMQL
jgi:hypothetical protein